VKNPNIMPAPHGHPRWGNPLNPKKYNPKSLWAAAERYFAWCDENPWIIKEAIKGGTSAGEIVDVPTQRPYSVEALCRFLNISIQTFENYSKREGYETFFEVCSHIRAVIDNQYFEGGMVGVFNANIVTRKLGLADKKELEGRLQVEQITGIEVK